MEKEVRGVMLEQVLKISSTAEGQALQVRFLWYYTKCLVNIEADRQLFLSVVTRMSSNYWLINMNGEKSSAADCFLFALKTSSCRAGSLPSTRRRCCLVSWWCSGRPPALPKPFFPTSCIFLLNNSTDGYSCRWVVSSALSKHGVVSCYVKANLEGFCRG